MNVLVKLPTRNRSARAREVLVAAHAYESGENTVRYLIAADPDDYDTQALPHRLDFPVEVLVKDHHSKIEACNSFLDDSKREWDVLVLLSDDMTPVRQNWDSILVSDLVHAFPDLDGALWYNDGFTEQKLCTLPIMGRRYYERFRYVYEPGYQSLWCDNEYTEVAQMLSRIRYSDQILFRHDHPGNCATATKDALYERNDKFWDVDKEHYSVRKARRFDVKLFDVLICAIPSRKDLLEIVEGQLRQQIKDLHLETNVGVLIENDSSRMTIGVKRNALLARSRAEYVAYVDDDDQVAPTYVESIVRAIGNCDVDCVGMSGKVRHGSKTQENWMPFEHSLRHNRYYQRPDGQHCRPPNHLNPIRRSIALQYPFCDVSHGEDTDFALRLSRRYALRTERSAGSEPIYLYFPSYWYAKYFGRQDGHAAINLSNPAGWPELEQDRRLDNLPPIDYEVMARHIHILSENGVQVAVQGAAQATSPSIPAAKSSEQGGAPRIDADELPPQFRNAGNDELRSKIKAMAQKGK